jgi:hypothetical protein
VHVFSSCPSGPTFLHSSSCPGGEEADSVDFFNWIYVLFLTFVWIRPLEGTNQKLNAGAGEGHVIHS